MDFETEPHHRLMGPRGTLSAQNRRERLKLGVSKIRPGGQVQPHKQFLHLIRTGLSWICSHKTGQSRFGGIALPYRPVRYGALSCFGGRELWPPNLDPKFRNCCRQWNVAGWFTQVCVGVGGGEYNNKNNLASPQRTTPFVHFTALLRLEFRGKE